MLNKSNDEKNAATQIEQIISSIKNKDRETLKSLFSEKAINDTKDFDDNIDYLFSFIKGKIDSWNKSSGPTVFDSNDYGHVIKEVNSYFYITTDEQKYFFLLRDYPVDTDHSDNVGLYMVLVVRAEDENKIWDENNKIIYDRIIEDGKEKIVKLTHAGIYIPLK